MKKSFTLIEVIISITLFSIIIIFLYSTLNLGKASNEFYSTKLKLFQNQNKIEILFYEDILNANKSSIKIYENSDKNSILTMQTNNTFHNVFNTNITYILSKKNELLRVESKNKYDKKKQDKFKFEKNKYVDVVKIKIIIFKIKLNKNSIVIYMENENEKSEFISIKLDK